MSLPKQERPSFALGKTVITRGANATLDKTEVLNAIARHARGEWGDLCDDDKQANDDALTCGARLLSAYHTSNGQKFWIITEADRSATTVLLPEEY